MKTYFYSGHITLRFGGKLTHEFSGLINADTAVKAFNGVYAHQLGNIEKNGGSDRSHHIQIDTFNVVEEV